MVLPETAAAEAARRRTAASSACAPATRAAAATGEKLGNFEPGTDIVAQVTVLAEGTQGHLTGVALDHFGLAGASAGVGARRQGGLEGREAARPGHPHDGLAAARAPRKYREFGGSFIYPMGDDMLTIGMVVGLDYRDAELSVHDLLQELKTHPMIRPLLEGGERLEWGAKTIPRAASTRCRGGCTRRACCSAATAPAWSTSRRSRASTTRSSRGGSPPRRRSRALQRGEDAGVRALRVRRRRAVELHLERPARGPRHAPGVRPRLLRRRRARGRDDGLEGPDQLGKLRDRAGRRAAAPAHGPRGELSRRRTASSPSTSSRRSSPPATRPATTSRTTSGSSSACRATSPSCGCTCARRRSTRSARTAGRPGHGPDRAVELRPVRRDHRQGRPPHAARGRLRPRVHADVVATPLDSRPRMLEARGRPMRQGLVVLVRRMAAVALVPRGGAPAGAPRPARRRAAATAPTASRSTTPARAPTTAASRSGSTDGTPIAGAAPGRSTSARPCCSAAHEDERLHARPRARPALLAGRLLQRADEGRHLLAELPHEHDPQRARVGEVRGRERVRDGAGPLRQHARDRPHRLARARRLERHRQPLPGEGRRRPGYHVKDRLENKLHDLVCAGRIGFAPRSSRSPRTGRRSTRGCSEPRRSAPTYLLHARGPGRRFTADLPCPNRDLTARRDPRSTGIFAKEVIRCAPGSLSPQRSSLPS